MRQTGEVGTYGAGGYAQLLAADLAESQAIVAELKEHLWVDR